MIISLAFFVEFGCIAKAKNNPVIAHRGAWKKEGLPENSRAALKKAIMMKCYGSEFDIHLTADDVLVVNHDDNFMGKDIASSAYQDLLNHGKLSNGETLPKAEEFLAIGKAEKHHGTKLIYEIKTSRLGKERTKEAVRKSVNLVKKMGVDDITEFILFDYEAAKELVKIFPGARVQALTTSSPEQVRADALTGIDFNIKAYNKHPDYLKQAKSLGLSTNVWTVDKKEDMLKFLNLEVDFITTNEPAMLFDILESK